MSGEHTAFPRHARPVESATDNMSIIPAHSTALRDMTFSEEGDMLATAGDKAGWAEHSLQLASPCCNQM